MENISSYIFEKLKVTKNSGDTELDMIPDELKKDFGRITLHFSGIAPLLMYYFEMEGQISDGKYENSSPQDHWRWINKALFVIDGNDYYTGGSIFRRSNKKYNLNEWVREVKAVLNGTKNPKEGWEFAIRLYDYGRIGRCLTINELKPHIKIDKYGMGIDSEIREIAELFGNGLRENPNITFEEIIDKSKQYTYTRNAVNKLPDICNERIFERFKNLDYTFEEFKSDVKSMENTINICKY